MQVLLIISDPIFAAGLGDALEWLGATVDYAATGRLGLQLATERSFDAIVVAADLRGTDSMRLCITLRQKLPFTPIAVAGIASGFESTMAAFNSGADEYWVRPLVFAEVHARLLALCRRSLVSHTLAVGDLQLNLASDTAWRQGHQLHLTRANLKLLQALMEAAPYPVTRAELEKRLWGGDQEVRSEVNLRAQVFSLRAIVDKPYGTRMIRTYRSVGYGIHPSAQAKPVAVSAELQMAM